MSKITCKSVTCSLRDKCLNFKNVFEDDDKLLKDQIGVTCSYFKPKETPSEPVKLRITEEQISILTKITLCNDLDLTDFEKDFLNDRIPAFKKYGGHAVMTKKQGKILTTIYFKTVLDYEVFRGKD